MRNIVILDHCYLCQKINWKYQKGLPMFWENIPYILLKFRPSLSIVYRQFSIGGFTDNFQLEGLRIIFNYCFFKTYNFRTLQYWFYTCYTLGKQPSQCNTILVIKCFNIATIEIDSIQLNRWNQHCTILAKSPKYLQWKLV